MHSRKKDEKIARLVNQLEKLGLPRRMLAIFACFVAISVFIVLAPHSGIPDVLYTLLLVPPVLLLFFVGESLSVPAQTFIDFFFLFAIVPYWLLLAFAVDRLIRVLVKVVHAAEGKPRVGVSL